MVQYFPPPDLPRYTRRPFPPYRYLPFHPDLPHPRNDPAGHSFGAEETFFAAFSASDWADCEPYLYGVDLFNHGYWWEAHEVWESLWLAAGRDTPAGQFVQGLIQLAGAQLKRYDGVRRGAMQLTQSGIARLQVAKGRYLGIEVAVLVAAAKRCLDEDRGEYPWIELHFEPGERHGPDT